MRTLARWTATSLGLGIVAFLSSIAAFWTFDRNVPIRPVTARLVTPRIVAGDKILIERTVYRDKSCAATAERNIYDSSGRRYDMGTMYYPSGSNILGFDSGVAEQSTPIDMALGDAHYVALVCYICNPVQALWPVCEPPRDIPFTVIATPNIIK